ncbi:unnamed protein product [Staurois parvus]|uniref:Uncharacterized protein n=1 Tax=Staurois parvus TaxID=386267 RepID=A0ABN9DEL6_9NEOB|nr:unnamed protein product [Staurois parvus]
MEKLYFSATSKSLILEVMDYWTHFVKMQDKQC